MRMCMSNTAIIKSICTKYTRNWMYEHVTHVLMYPLGLEVSVAIWKSYIPLYTRAIYVYIIYIYIYILQLLVVKNSCY